ncbi:MAG: nucleotidyl transferase AbiEii/AbiGii toxin family protein [Flexilinea sp.]|nr:nucleotidyl transferase AbiEii/AbiGii toxin family protein [Flexilinea sp.]
MTQTSMQIKALIRNKAAGDSDKAQILLRIYMMERFLERVSVSKYKNNFILKGGMLVSSLVGVDLRTTMDIDTTVRALPLTQNEMRKILDEIMTIDLQDGVRFEIQKVIDIMEGHEYEGVRFFVKGYLDRMWQTIKIDISTGDSITPAAIEYNLQLLLEKRDIELWAYNIETLLAEKLETIMSRAEGNTRMRDFL